MTKETKFKLFIDEHKDNLKMAFAHGNFEDAIKVVFDAGFEEGWKEGMTDATQAPSLEY
jgi:hypothetical protein